ncbi:hypothetical protein B0H14DRAFT_2609758 [Mycena olivaceomarginata]|nr:hypothetical protein B0H14DRAFT_2609758 [Mycena olivaceomarginata]
MDSNTAALRIAAPSCTELARELRVVMLVVKDNFVWTIVWIGKGVHMEANICGLELTYWHSNTRLERRQVPTLEEKVCEAGHHFVVMEALFLVDARLIWTVEDFDFTMEFESKANKVQGQPHNVRSTTACLASTQPLATGYTVQAFKSLWELINSSISGLPTLTLGVIALIRYKPATDVIMVHYSAFNAKILYDDYNCTINVDKIFRHSLLLKIYTLVFPSTSCTEWWLSPQP